MFLALKLDVLILQRPKDQGKSDFLCHDSFKPNQKLIIFLKTKSEHLFLLNIVLLKNYKSIFYINKIYKRNVSETLVQRYRKTCAANKTN